MTNLEAAPAEVICDDAARMPAAEVLLPREVPLGGIRAMTVRRTLPQRRRSFIGAWCFVDHYGPDDVALTGGMQVPPHPHIGLQTVSWLFSGQVEHRDSLGNHAMVRPGELNLMTAGRGISHSEDSTADTTVLHGVQLWLALPERDRTVLPAFESYVPPVHPLATGEVRVFLGSLAGSTSPVGTFSPLLGAEVTLRAGTEQTLTLDPRFEHGFLVDDGGLEVGGVAADRGELLYLPVGTPSVTLRAAAGTDLRVVLLGGVPLGERIVMWWNFIGSSHDQVEQARADWQAEIAGVDGNAADGNAADGPDPRDAPRGTPRFGLVTGHPSAPLPAPVMPHHRLLPRD